MLGKLFPTPHPRDGGKWVEISEIVDQFGRAAKNAMLAWFNGMEIQGAHGYLVDQFPKYCINDKADEHDTT